MTHIRIVDLPCGYGKSTRISKSFEKKENYIVVVPFLSEVEPFTSEAKRHSEFLLTEPTNKKGNKSDHCEELIKEGRSIVCTHALFYRLGTLATIRTGTRCAEFKPGCVPVFENTHLLDDYNLIIDEVVDPFQTEQSVRNIDFDEDYLKMGLAEELPDGRIVPTELWNAKFENGSRTFCPLLYQKAKSGALYRMGKNFFFLTIPIELLLKPKSVTIYTYLAEGTLLLQFLRKFKDENPGTFTLKVERLGSSVEAAWREDVANALTVLSIPSLEKQGWNYRAQLKSIKTLRECASVGHKLRKFKDNELNGLNLNDVMLTCARDVWYSSNPDQKPKAGRLAKHARMFGRPVKKEVFDTHTESNVDKWSTTGVSFVPNTTRGTNAHSGCHTAVYLYNQFPNPQLLTFLGMERSSQEAHEFSDAYALTELVQWLFRSAIRVGGENGSSYPYRPRSRVTLYMPSQRMRNLLINWLLTGRCCGGQIEPNGVREIELLARLEGRTLAVAA